MAQTLKLSLDLITLILGISTIILAQRTSIGGKFGQAFTFILAGIFILTVNHLLDSVFLADYLKMLGHTQDILQAAIVHRLINFTAFVSMFTGFVVIYQNSPKK